MVDLGFWGAAQRFLSRSLHTVCTRPARVARRKQVVELTACPYCIFICTSSIHDA